MPNERKPRIALDPLALRALRVWSAIEDKDPGGLASELIMNHMPARVRDALRDLDPKPSEPPRVAAIDSGESTGPGASQKKKRLFENPDALQQIRELWSQSPRPSLVKMSERIGYPKSTIAEHIKKMRERGELVD